MISEVKDVITITTKVNLKTVINELIKKFPCITKIYLFGSRAYKTNSARSDVDLIVFSEDLIAPDDLRAFYDKYQFCDFFQGDNSSITSVVNLSQIKGRNLIKKLDAIVLWDSYKKFSNEGYLIQIINKYQRYLPSLGDYSSAFKAFKRKINNPLLSEYSQAYFQESMVEYANRFYVSCVSLFGLACEDLVISLKDCCVKKYISDNPTMTENDWYRNFVGTHHNRVCAKNNLIALESYFANQSYYFNTNGFNKLDEMLVCFDVIRNYRNDADHPSDFKFEKEYCDELFAALSLHIDKILNLITHLKTIYH